MVSARPLDALRFPLRTAGFVGLTFGMYGLLEVDTAISPAADREVVLHTWMRRYGRALLKLYGLDVRAGGLFQGELAAGRSAGAADPEGAGYCPGRDAAGLGRLFVMNHRSALDIMITLAFFEATVVSRADLAGWPVIGMAARRVGTLFVDRSSKRSGSAVVQAMSSALKGGRGVMVYPEGTTFSGDEVRPFRAGGFTAACRVGAEIVPVGLVYGGAESSYVDESFTAHMARVSRARRIPVALEVGAPIATVGQDVGEVRDESHRAVQALVRRARARLAADG
ncbi:lysophospholipid acyltransferase family protein [Sorangium sp. So ce327]|jgi:1-acyl-sn-glycerol-3-phosphate acyltransferase|uniref:lysophospholipid acyltransferase family protein n=1 Tax=unclassified Sorangium TaxID=2621164 RepID=UPI003F623CCD